MPLESRTVERGKFDREIIVRKVDRLYYSQWKAWFKDSNEIEYGNSQLEAITRLVEDLPERTTWGVCQIEYARDYQTG